MTTNDPKQRPGGAGYRGTLPAREDRLAKPWLFIVAGIFVAIIVLSVLGVPSRLIPDPTPVPLPTNPPATSSPSASEDASPSLGASPSPSPSTSPSPASS